MGLWLFIFGFQFLNAQLFVKDDALKTLNGTTLYADTIIQLSDKSCQVEIKTKKQSSVYVVKGTVISNMEEVKNAEFIRIPNRKFKKSPVALSKSFSKQKKSSSKKENITSRLKEVLVIQKLPVKKKGVLQENFCELQLIHIPNSKKQFPEYEDKVSYVFFSFFTNERQDENLVGIIGFNASKSWKIRPPPIIC